MEPFLDDSSDMDVSRPLDVVATHRKDGLGVVVSCDDLITELLGWRPDEIVGRRLTELIHTDDQETAVGAWISLLAGRPGERHEMIVRILCSDHSYALVAIGNTNRLDTEGVVDSELQIAAPGTEPPARAALADALLSDSLNAHVVTPLLREHERFLHRLTEALPMGAGRDMAGS